MSLSIDNHPPNPTVFGPYCPLPRRPKPRRPILLAAGGIAGVGVFLHCIAPLIISF